jgi:hypothetical protein
MQSGRFGFRRVVHGPASSQWVVHTAELFPGAPESAGRRPTYRVASLYLQQDDPTTASGLLLLFADLPAEAERQLLRDLQYLLVGADDALLLDVIRATDLGLRELLGEVRRFTAEAARGEHEEADEPGGEGGAPPGLLSRMN